MKKQNARYFFLHLHEGFFVLFKLLEKPPALLRENGQLFKAFNYFVLLQDPESLVIVDQIYMFILFAVLRIRIGSGDPHPARPKTTNKREKVKKKHVLKRWMFFLEVCKLL
jgi:hypothetical protein